MYMKENQKVPPRYVYETFSNIQSSHDPFWTKRENFFSKKTGYYSSAVSIKDGLLIQSVRYYNGMKSFESIVSEVIF